MTRLSAAQALARYGPSTGDRIRLADTGLWIRVAEDRQAPGDEPQWGYGKTVRQRMAQAESAAPSELDTVILGAVVVDPSLGVVKADIGIKNGRIVEAGNPDDGRARFRARRGRQQRLSPVRT